MSTLQLFSDLRDSALSESTLCRALLRLLIALCLAALPQAPANSLDFSTAELESQLPQSSVMALMQDRTGFLWVGTREGLSRWSGGGVRIWRAQRQEEAAIPGSIVDQVLEDRQGDIWLRARYWDREASTPARLHAPEFRTVSVYPDARNSLLFQHDGGALFAMGPAGVRRFDEARDAFVAVYPFPREESVQVVSAVHLKDERIVAALANGEIWTIAPGEVWRELPHELTMSDGGHDVRIFADSQGRIWAAGTGLTLLDQNEWIFRRVSTPEFTRQRDHMPPIVELPSGSLLLGSMLGVLEYEPDVDRVVGYHKLDLRGVRDDQQWVMSLLLDRNGGVWAGSLWGLQYAYGMGQALRLLRPRDEDGNDLTSTVASILEHSNGSVWLSSFGGGHVRVDSELGQAESVFYEGRHDWIWMLKELADGRVLAAESSRLLISDPRGTSPPKVLPPAPADGDQVILAAEVDDRGAIWYLTTDHIGFLNPEMQAHKFAVAPIGEPTALRLDGDELWIGTTAQLLRGNRSRAAMPEVVLDDLNVTTLTVGEELIWVGTRYEILGVDKQSLTVRYRMPSTATPSSFVNCIIETSPRQIWYSTSRGIVRSDFREGDAPRSREQLVFTSLRELGNREFNRNACTRGSSGRLYFGGDRGVTYFDPDTLTLLDLDIPLVITRSSHYQAEEIRETPGPVSDELHVQPNTHTLQLELAALAMPSAAGVRYSTRLEGLDENWVDQDEQSVVAYTNLSPGRYTFTARAISAHGVMSRRELRVPVLVHPEFWQTWWFKLLVGLLAILVPMGFLWLWLSRRYQLRLSAVRALEARDRERLRISRDMHDEIGAGLTEIAIMSDLARRQTQGGDDVSGADSTADRLSSIGERTRAMLAAIGEIIWATDPRNDDVNRFIAYLREYSGRYLDNVELAVSYEFPEETIQGQVPPDFRRSVLLILKEALSNVVKHAGASRVDLQLSINNQVLELRVSDNGVTSYRSTNAHGHGVENMSVRARSVDGHCEVQGSTEGTVVHLIAPLPGPSEKSPP